MKFVRLSGLILAKFLLILPLCWWTIMTGFGAWRCLDLPPEIGPAPPPPAQRGILLAWDPVKQKERWHTIGGGGIGGGTVTTAGNLVFQVIPDGRLVAYRADTGEKLLDIKTGLGGGMGPPITYELDGKQYIAVTGGQGIVVARNIEPGAPLPVATPTTIFPKLMVFMLDGKPLP